MIMNRSFLLRRFLPGCLTVTLSSLLGIFGSAAAMATPVTPSSQQTAATGQDRLLVDPLGAVLSHVILSSAATLASNPGAFMAASLFAMTTGGEGIGLPAFDRCANRFSSSTSLQGLRFVSGGLCAMLDSDSRAEIAKAHL